ncbi:hypothetical protein [Neolewinella agarilytica]|uniref:hypothetical protein n=1 Tax=Neolewinella agarilytica TaxID=478744 RepID=UPI0023540D1E|nr:hypothetical protein [Neolewinella agarilytica]
MVFFYFKKILVSIFLMLAPCYLSAQFNISLEYGLEQIISDNFALTNLESFSIESNNVSNSTSDFLRLGVSRDLNWNNLSLGVVGTLHSRYSLSYELTDFNSTSVFGPAQKVIGIGGRLYDFGINTTYKSNLSIGKRQLGCSFALTLGTLIHSPDNSEPFTNLGPEAIRIEKVSNTILSVPFKNAFFVQPSAYFTFRFIFLRASYLHPVIRSIVDDVTTEDTNYYFFYRKKMVQFSLGINHEF